MKYVNDVGPIKTINGCPQKGASREVPDDHPEILATMRKIDNIINGSQTSDEFVEQQMCSPLAKVLLTLGVISEEKIRSCLVEQFKIDADTKP